MDLNNIPTIKGATHPRKRLARGEGNGHGKTAGKGHKGQKARAGRGIRVGFEGGQMPLYRKLPRRGFNNKEFRTVFASVNLGELTKVTSDTIGRDELVAAGLIRKSDVRIKLLGDGTIDRAVKITVDAVSASAKAKIEAAGGSVTIPESPVTEEA